MQTVLYTRVSTLDQTAAHQKAHAESAGFKITKEISETISGVSVNFADRPQAVRLFDILQPGDVLVVRWVDRLGRDYDDVTKTIREFMSRGVIVRTVINNFTFDGSTTDPIQKAVRDALISFMAALSQAQAEATKAAQKAGIAHAKEAADGVTKYKGKKPSFNRAQYAEVMADTANNVSALARSTKLTRQTVLRIRKEPAKAVAALIKWGM